MEIGGEIFENMETGGPSTILSCQSYNEF